MAPSQITSAPLTRYFPSAIGANDGERIACAQGEGRILKHRLDVEGDREIMDSENILLLSFSSRGFSH
jgi:hypothetical protein